MNAPHKVPNLTPPSRGVGLISYFWDIRSRMSSPDDAVNLATIKDWQESCYITLERWERDCIFAMDSAFRRARVDVIKYHADRDAEKAKNEKGRRGK